MRLQATATSGSAANQYIPAFCFSTDAVGDFVYVMGDAVGNIYQVTKLDPTNESKMPFAGVIIEKSGPQDCIVQLTGVVQGAYSALTPGKLILAGLDAKPAETIDRPTTGVRIRQVVGIALSSTDMLIQPMVPVITLPV